MQNGIVNGASYGGAHPVSINPMQAAQFALMFMQRADMKANERDAFAIAEGLLNAILKGQVVLSSPPETPREEPPAPPPTPPQPEA